MHLEVLKTPKLLPTSSQGKKTGSYDFNAELEWNLKVF